MIHGAYSSKLSKTMRNSIRNVLKDSGNPELARALKSVGFGGRMAPHSQMGSSLLE